MSRPEITTPEVLSDESVVELSLRPQRLETLCIALVRQHWIGGVRAGGC